MTAVAPNRSEREKCWVAKDAYWKCLEDNHDDASKCKKQRIPYEAECSRTWVKYFDRRRDYLKYKEKIEKDGYEPIDAKKS